MPPLRIKCPFGHEMQMAQTDLGQRISCPMCDVVLVVERAASGEFTPRFEVYCRNQHMIRVKQRYLNHEIRCPACNDVVSVHPESLVRLHDVQGQDVARPVLARPAATGSASAKPVKAIPISAPSKPNQPTATPAVVSTGQLPVAQAILLDDIPIAEIDPDDAGTARSQKLPVVLSPAERDGLRMTDTGLRLTLLGTSGLLATFAFEALFGFFILVLFQGITTLEGLASLKPFTDIVWWIVHVAYGLSWLAVVFGGLMSVAVPWVSGAKPWSLAQLVLALLAAGVLSFVVYSQNSSLSLSAMSTFLSHLATQLCTVFLAWAAFIMLLWQLARFSRKRELALRLLYLLIGGLAFLTLLIMLGFVPSLVTSWNSVGRWAYHAICLLGQLIGSTLLIMYQVNLVGEVRNALARKI